jgi:hypothetical protein
MRGLPKGLVTGVSAKMPGDWKKVADEPKRGRTRHAPGKMNKREAAYSLELEARKRAGEILDWQYEAVTLKIAEKPEGCKMKAVRYTPDFFVVADDGVIEFHEVKGHAEGDWIVKWKVCIERYPWFRFVLVEK